MPEEDMNEFVPTTREIRTACLLARVPVQGEYGELLTVPRWAHFVGLTIMSGSFYDAVPGLSLAVLDVMDHNLVTAEVIAYLNHNRELLDAVWSMKLLGHSQVEVINLLRPTLKRFEADIDKAYRLCSTGLNLSELCNHFFGDGWQEIAKRLNSKQAKEVEAITGLYSQGSVRGTVRQGRGNSNLWTPGCDAAVRQKLVTWREENKARPEAVDALILAYRAGKQAPQ
jgi:hypothetical protein